MPGKYASFKYGADRYGTSDPIQYLTWYFGVYWNASFVDESSKMIDFQAVRGRDHLLSTGGSGWERFKAGEVTATFDNSDGRYDPYNTGGPLYGFLLPGRVVRITVAVQMPYSGTSTTYAVMRGIISDIQTVFRSGQRQARIVVKDGLEWLARRSATLAVVTDAMALVTAQSIATGVGYDAVDDWDTVILGGDSLSVPFAWGNDNSAIALINQFVDAEAGQVFQDRDGVLTLVANAYTQNSTTDLDSVKVLRDFELKQPWEVVRTRAAITANPAAEGVAALLWSFGVDDAGVTDYPYILYNTDVLTIDAIFSSSSGQGIASTSPTVDYYVRGIAVNVDVTANVSESDEDIGTGLRITLTKDGTISGIDEHITWIGVTATPIEVSDSVVLTSENTGASTTYGQKTFTLNTPWIQAVDYAQSYADYIVTELAAAHLFPTVIIENRGDVQFDLELYIDKIHLTISALGIDATFRIGKISHKWINSNGFAVRTVLKLEPVLGVL